MSSTKKIEKLTAEQEQALIVFRQQWLEIGTNCDPSDRPRAQAAITAMYTRIGEPAPVFYWVNSPASACLWIAILKSFSKELGKDQLWDQLRDQLWDQLRDQLWDQLRGQLGDQLGGQLWGQLGDQLRGQLRGQLWDQLWDQLWGQLGDQLRGQLRGLTQQCFWGSNEAYWVAHYRFAREIGVQYPAQSDSDLNLWSEVVQSCGWWWPYKGVCVVSDRPESIAWESTTIPSRLHSLTAPSVRFRDGYELYAIKGLRVDRRLVMEPETITVAEIESQPNAELRRVLIERYGESKYLVDSNAKVLNHDDRWGTLYRKEQEDDEPITMVRVKNSTPEPDGSIKIYWLKVHPEIRPLFGPKRFGDPQKPTALNAIGSTFGLTGKQYAEALQVET